MNHKLRWPIAATAITKRNTVNKEILTNKKVLLTYKKGLLSYKQDLLTYTKRICLQIQNNHGKFLRPILAANSHGKSYVKQKIIWSILCVAEFHT